MKYLFLILVCYAVNCQNIGNNYFVVEMPEDNLQQHDFKKPFKVYWNVPTMQCASKKIPFQNLYEKYGIIQNDNDQFLGEKIVIIYNEVEFPAIITNKNTGKTILRNGGVPQEGNLENHLNLFEKELNDKIPDPYYDGIGIIDFESWRPVFLQNFGKLVPHKHLSIEIEKQLHNWWPKMWIEREATLRFEAAARKFMQTTLSMVKKMRPNALWGYYGFPYCFNMRNRDMTEKCAKDTDKENDSIYWLWAESTALFPSLYSSVTLSSSQLSSLIKGRVKETSRVRGKNTPFFPYFWFRYRDAGFITEKDLKVALTTLYQSDASGFIIWGSSNDVNTVEKCNKLLNYVETVLGPNVAKYTKQIKRIQSHNLENVEINSEKSSTDYDGFTYSPITQVLYDDEIFATETSTEYNTYTYTDRSSQIPNNDEMPSTETSITYNEHNNIDENTETLNTDDLLTSSSESSNAYSEYLPQHNIKDFKKPFKVYWNVPTMQCASKKIPFQNLYEKYGIIQNDNDQFLGEKIVIIYNEVEFPTIITNKNTGKTILRNGGVPQEGNLENHLNLFEKELNDKIPDPYYDGIGIIDFESWRPVFLQNFGKLVPHKHLSIEIEKQLHNWWPKMWIEREATLRFEAAARKFMQTTLSMVKKMRPNALWGYYGFPYCFNMRNRDMTEKCAKDTDKENDSIYWLWAESTALFPSLYSSVTLSSSQLSSLIKGRVKETSRVRGKNTPFFPYFWFRYRDAGFITEKDLKVALTTLYQSDASGFIIWGSSNDVNTVEKCKKLLNYVETVLGPNVAKYTKQIKRIQSHNLENVEINSEKSSTDYDGFTYSPITQVLYDDEIFATETSTEYNTYTYTDRSSQITNNDEMPSTETSITYNEHNNIDENTETFNTDDLLTSSSESSNAYSEYLPQHNIKDFKKPFKVYWNVPTMQCASKKIPFQNLYEKYGIIQNDNDQFLGEKIVIIYNEVQFPAIITNKTTGKTILRNGGVPQEGNLENHLNLFEKELNDKIPDPYYDGIGIIDFESWRPVFLQNFGKLVPHKHLSIEIEKQLHNWWPKMWIEREATLRFEAAARKFMQTTLSMVKKMRPNALWGYYGFPYCFNMRNRDMTEKCAKDTDKENDSIYWLWAESTALFPSLYSSVTLSSSQLSSLIKGRVKETSRVRGKNTPFFPYFWFRYRDAGFITEKDLKVALTTLYQSDASGFIIWGSSNDVNTVEKCKKLLNYVETVLGPNVAKYTKQIKRIQSHNLENVEINSEKSSTDYDGFTYSPITQVLYDDEIFATETSTEYNTYTYTDRSSQITNNDEMPSTETSITYNEHNNIDENTETFNNDDLLTSSSESSTGNNEYTYTDQSLQTLNNDVMPSTGTSITYNEHNNIDENTETFNNDDLLTSSSESSTGNNEYTYTDQSLQTLNNDVMPSTETSITYNEHNNIDENTETFNNDDLLTSSSESSTGNNEYTYTDQSVQTLNNDVMPSTGTSITYNEHNNIDEYLQTLSNDNLSSSVSDGLTDYGEYTISDQVSQTSDNEISNEAIPIVYNEYTQTDKNVKYLDNVEVISSSSSSSTFDDVYTHSDHSKTTLNNVDIYFIKTPTLYNEYLYKILAKVKKL